MVDTSSPTLPNTTVNPDAYGSLFNQILQRGAGAGWNSSNTGAVLGTLQDQIKNQFTNLVGRAPTDAEMNQALSQLGGQIMNSSGGFSDIINNPQDARNIVQGYVGDTFQKTAQDYATQRLQDQQTQANSLGDLFEQQGNSAINDTQSALLDYQQKLFERLQPNLLTSLKSQGLLDTGGMNEAVAGVQGDLANNASNYIAQLKLNNAQGANQIRFGGAAAPYQYQQGVITGQAGMLGQAGANANTFNNNTFMDNINYQHQLGLIGAQRDAMQSLQPSFLRNLGQSFGTSFGNSAGQWFSPGAGQQSQGQSGGNYANAAKFLG